MVIKFLDFLVENVTKLEDEVLENLKKKSQKEQMWQSNSVISLTSVTKRS